MNNKLDVSEILAIDPGTTKSAWVYLVGGEVSLFGKEENESMLNKLDHSYVLAIERIASYGMPVGEEVFETVYWSGRFAQAWDGPVVRVPRVKVKLHLCHNSMAKDSNIRQAIIDRFGGKASIKKGGNLYKISGDIWAALGVALTVYDKINVLD